MKNYLSKVISQLIFCLILTTSVSASSFSHERLGTVEFKDVSVGNAVRILSEMSKKYNIVATQDAKDKKVSLYLKKASIEGTVDALCRITGLWYRRDSEHNAFYIMTEEEFSKEIVVKKESATRIFDLKHQNVSDAAYSIKSLFGSRVKLTKPEENDSYQLDGDISGGGRNNSNNRNNNRNNGRNNSNSTASAGGGTANNSDKVEARREFFTDRELASKGQAVVSEEELIRTRVRSEAEIFVTWNYLHNLLMVRTSDKKAMADIQALIKRIDLPAQQVLLEVKILRANLGKDERSIFDFAYQQGQIKTGVDGNGDPIVSPRKSLNLGRFPLEGGAFLAQLNGGNLTATIEWLKTQNRLNLVAQPNIVSANNKEAQLTIGENRIMVTGASTRFATNNSGTNIVLTPETKEENIGTLLRIWPRINDDKTVTLDILQSNSTLNKDATTIPVSGGNGTIVNIPIDSVTVSTTNLTAIASHGSTIAIGGMIETSNTELHEKVPLLGDIPVLGKMFRKDVTSESRSELIILITPWVSDNPQTAHTLHQDRIDEWSDIDNLDEHLSKPNKQQVAQWSSKLQTMALDSIRFAMHAQSQSSSELCASGRTAAPRFTQWKLSNNLQIDAIQHCISDGVILTQAKMINLSQRSLKVGPFLFDQGWIATSGESGVIDAGGSRLIYLASDESPEKLLKNNKVEFFYAKGAVYGH